MPIYSYWWSAIVYRVQCIIWPHTLDAYSLIYICYRFDFRWNRIIWYGCTLPAMAIRIGPINNSSSNYNNGETTANQFTTPESRVYNKFVGSREAHHPNFLICACVHTLFVHERDTIYLLLFRQHKPVPKISASGWYTVFFSSSNSATRITEGESVNRHAIRQIEAFLLLLNVSIANKLYK